MKTYQNDHLRNPAVMDQSNFVAEYLRDLAASNLSPDMNVDASTSNGPITFSALPPAGKYWMIARMIIYYSSNVVFAEDKFANLTALPLGISIQCNNTEIILWNDNIDVISYMYDIGGKAAFTLTDKSIHGRMSFNKISSDEHGLKVYDETNGFAAVLQDDLSGLTQFRIRIEGVEYDKNPYNRT